MYFIKTIINFFLIPFRIYKKYKIKKNINVYDYKKLVPIIREKNLSYLNDNRICQILKSIKYLNEKKIKGMFIETGIALGGTLILIAGYSNNRKVLAFDTFEMIPPPSKEDPPEVHERYNEIKFGKSQGINGDIYYGYRNDLFNFVNENLNLLIAPKILKNIKLVKGLIQNTMRLEDPVSFAHIDVDWYEPVKFSLTQVWPKLVDKGIIILDDYYDWGGCKKAVDEFFKDKSDYHFDNKGGNLKITKLKKVK